MSPAEQQRMGVDLIERLDPRSSAADVARTLALPALHEVTSTARGSRLSEKRARPSSAVAVTANATRE